MKNARESTANESNSTSFRCRVFSLSVFGATFFIVLTLIFSASCNRAATAKDDVPAEDKLKDARNEAALRQAQENIERFRKGDVQIRILDAKGNPVRNAKLNIKQISHDFKFGCYLKIDDLAPEKLPAYEKHFAELFNFAVVGTYWRFVENKQGVENWDWFEREVALSRKLGVPVEAAPILWGTNKAGTPKWLPQNKDELLPVLRTRLESTLTKYADVVDDWEIVNEPLAANTDVFAQAIGREYIESAFLLARKTAPTKRLMLNESGIFGASEARNRNRDKYFDLLKTLVEKGTPVDIIGIQAHANGEWYEPANVAEQIDRYAALGKPIQITEFSAQTFNYQDRKTPQNISGNYRSGVWDAESQAEFYREFYTIAFSRPQVEAIVQWGLDDERAWLPGIGVIDVNGNPKPNYKALDHLLNNQWRTTLQIQSGKSEMTKFRGFYGKYEIEVVANGKTTKTTFVLKRNNQNEWLVQI